MKKNARNAVAFLLNAIAAEQIYQGIQISDFAIRVQK